MSEELENSFYDEEGVFKSRRFPDQHGGQPDAAAAPDNRLEKKEIDHARSEVAIHNKNSALKQALHGEHPPSPMLPMLANILNTSIEQLRTLKMIQDVLEYQIPLGQLRAFTIAFPAASKLTHIDFADSTQTYGLPSGVVVNEPNRKLCKLKIFNDGPGNIKFASNLPRSDGTTEFVVNAGEFDDSLNFIYSVIWSVNVLVLSGAPTVRFAYVV